MSATIDGELDSLKKHGNLRVLPDEAPDSIMDFSSNDYLGLARRIDIQQSFLRECACISRWLIGASASRLLASRQAEFNSLEKTLEDAYNDGREALVFNSGYHANTGIIPALASDSGTVILADKLVHASIIDGIRLSKAPFNRFRHNDMCHLAQLLRVNADAGRKALVIVESVYSMDGDSPDMQQLVNLKRQYPDTVLYVDEAHAIGVAGKKGLGMTAQYAGDVDITVGTFGKALASVGAYVMCQPQMRSYLVNKARSLIFSTAMPPLSAQWNGYIFKLMQTMDSERRQLRDNAEMLAHEIGGRASHIQCVIIGDAVKTVQMSRDLAAKGLCVLPIRRPTVPPGTERLRISLSAAHSSGQIGKLATTLKELI